jgi:hypothetical protein
MKKKFIASLFQVKNITIFFKFKFGLFQTGYRIELKPKKNYAIKI